MKRYILTGVLLVISAYFLSVEAAPPRLKGQEALPPSARASVSLRAASGFGKMPLSFIPNHGQVDERAAFYIQGKDKTIYFGAEGVTFALAASGEAGFSAEPDGSPAERWTVKLDFLGANPGVRPAGLDAKGAVVSYFQGAPTDWKTGLPLFSRLVYANLWPGIDLVYSGTTEALKSEFIVHPGADPSRIRLAYRGASKVGIGTKGTLVITTPAGSFEDGTPVGYQERGGRREDVSLTYDIKKDEGGGNEEAVVYGFKVGAYDRTQTLVLDPVILIRCGYLGGPGLDFITGIAVDKAGSVYLAGATYSTGAFPVAVGPDRTFNGGVDAFVAKVDPSGTTLQYCGYIGGSGNDYAYGIALDSAGGAYVAGYTSSTEATFPATVGPDLTHNGSIDAFVAKVNPGGTALEYCGYLGGAAQDYGKGIAVDALGRAYVAGSTSSSPATFPAGAGSILTYGGGQDAFVARVNAGGEALEYCVYVGGSAEDAGTAIAVDGAGRAYLAGSTNSPTTATPSFPVFIGPSTTYGGNFDGFAAGINADGSDVFFCGYIGGRGNDYATGIAVDPLGAVYIVGTTSSTDSSFPALVGPNLTHGGGYYDAFVAKTYPEGLSFEYCGYIGGADYDAGAGIAADGRGYAVVTGYTSSPEASFPVKLGPGLTHGGSFDAFVAKVDATGFELGFCGYVGGADADYGTAIALGAEASGDVYLAGNAYSTEFTFPVVVGPALVHGGGRDGFAAKVFEKSITLTEPNGGETWSVGLPETISWHSDGQVGDVRLEFSTDSGTTWEVIADSTPNDGSYVWIIPDAASTTCLIRVSEADDGDPSDTSRAVFVISGDPALRLTSPNGGETWRVGSTQTITWQWGGEVGDIYIEVTTDGAATWTEIVAATANDGSYEWVVPDTVSDQCRIRISEVGDAIPMDVSDAPFSIVAAASPPTKRPATPAVIRTIKRFAVRADGGLR